LDLFRFIVSGSAIWGEMRSKVKAQGYNQTIYGHSTAACQRMLFTARKDDLNLCDSNSLNVSCFHSESVRRFTTTRKLNGPKISRWKPTFSITPMRYWLSLRTQEFLPLLVIPCTVQAR